MVHHASVLVNVMAPVRVRFLVWKERKEKRISEDLAPRPYIDAAGTQ